ncbi:sigma-70 family RNA polymerase sigma factor [Hylemonella sp. W303a]|uniref:sigma-70 family RNA polymerase sigma factor n=1 Tax=Hylemonella sp. W303a TaxID=3389873 RepID=UPI00396B1B77
MSSVNMAGPADPMGDLYHDHHAWLRGWLRKKLGCAHSAADFAHDTFCRLLAMPTVPDLREPRAFLVTTATRLLIDHARRARIERAYLETWAVLQADAHASSPEEHQEAIDTLLGIVALLEDLPVKVRQAFLWSRLEEVPQAEIAARLGVSVSMVKQYIARAMLQCYSVVHGLPEA